MVTKKEGSTYIGGLGQSLVFCEKEI